ncbi:MAG: anti-sigma F factor [Eubacteriales bacterium]
MMTTENFATFQFPSKSCNEGFARSATACFVAQLDPTLEELNDIKTVISEGVTNATVHAYPDSIGKISIKLRLLEGNLLEITIQDWGVGIPNVDQARTPLFTTGNEDRSGMGFTIMESFMDSLKIRSREGKGTTIVLRRKFRRRLL